MCEFLGYEPDPDTLPEPEFDGLSWYEICEYLDDYDRERYYAMKMDYYDFRGFYFD